MFPSVTNQVSRQSKQLLALMLGRPLLKIERLNPALFKFVVELREVKVRLYNTQIYEQRGTGICRFCTGRMGFN